MKKIIICLLVVSLDLICAKLFGVDFEHGHRKLKNDVDDDDCKLSVVPPNPKSQCCGVDMSFSNRIIGGQPTNLLQYPWMAIIEYRNRKTNAISTGCGGSLISGAFVLTAGHCVSGEGIKTKMPKNVILGEYNKANLGKDCVTFFGRKQCIDAAIKIEIAKITVHEKYNDVSLDNNIALIRLKKIAPYTDTIRPICLPTTDLTTDHKNLRLDVAGWGLTSQIKGIELIKQVSNVKRHVQVPFVPLKICQQIYLNLNPNQLCAGGEKGKDSCLGDSGGPLMNANFGVYEQVGIVSFGPETCGKENIPAVYTSVFKYLNWIRKHIGRF